MACGSASSRRWSSAVGRCRPVKTPAGSAWTRGATTLDVGEIGRGPGQPHIQGLLVQISVVSGMARLICLQMWS
jgi:hypothetical protein